MNEKTGPNRHRMDLPDVVTSPDNGWGRLTAAQKESAKIRALAVLNYLDIAKPTRADADRAAKEAQVGRARFFELLRIWREGERMSDLAPHGRRASSRKTRLGGPKQERLTNLIEAAIESGIERTPKDLLAAVFDTWDKGEEPPSESTIRSYITRQLSRRVDGLGNTIDAIERRRPLAADRFGEVIVLDTTIAAVSVGSGTAPKLSLAIDLATALPLGFALGGAVDDVAMALDCLLDARRRLDRMCASASLARPRIVLPVLPGWMLDQLEEAIAEGGIVAERRADYTLRAGDLCARLVGENLGVVRLLPGRLRQAGTYRPGSTKWKGGNLTEKEAHDFLAANLERTFDERSTDPFALRRLDLGRLGRGT